MNGRAVDAVAIGASAGAVEALSEILPKLPGEYPLPILVVVHLPVGKEPYLVDLFRARCRLAVREAEDKQRIEPGTVYLAPSDYHLLIEQDGSLSLSSEEPIHFSRPSIDVMLETAADAFGSRLAGVVLSGANADGARGLQRVQMAGGLALVQEPSTAAARAMPDAALAACPGARALTLPQIVDVLLEIAPV